MNFVAVISHIMSTVLRLPFGITMISVCVYYVAFPSCYCPLLMATCILITTALASHSLSMLLVSLLLTALVFPLLLSFLMLVSLLLSLLFRLPL